MLAAGLSWPPAAATLHAVAGAQPDSSPRGEAASHIGAPARDSAAAADFRGESVSPDARTVADWVAASRDNRGLPFMIVDKIEARVFLLDGDARLLGTAPALLGSARGDETVEGIGRRSLASIRPPERTTPAGRFVASLGHDYEQDILWVDYRSALSLHRVIRGQPSDRRHERLASPTPRDNRISYGCINVPAEFYDDLVAPVFAGTVGIVYILPEDTALDAVFALEGRMAPPAASVQRDDGRVSVPAAHP